MTDNVPQEDLPLRVTGIEVQDPMVTVFGEGWALTLACPWEGAIRDCRFSWEDDDVEDRAWDLVGQDLVAVDVSADAATFRFSSGWLKATPDTDFDPWVMRLPSGIFVGSLP
jgi:hypothetical protein